MAKCTSEEKAIDKRWLRLVVVHGRSLEGSPVIKPRKILLVNRGVE